MKLHAAMVIFNLLNFYFSLNEDEECINYNDLEKAFNILTNRMRLYEDAILDTDFNTSMNDLLETYDDILEKNNNYIYVSGDLNEIIDDLLTKIEFTSNDDLSEECLLNTEVFKALNLEIPLEEYQYIFNINKEIIDTYKSIIIDETNNIINYLNIIYLRRLVTKLYKTLANLTYIDILKIKMCIAHYNLNLNDYFSYYENTGWHIALFSYDPKLISVLNHDRVSYIIDEVDPLDEESENKENDYNYDDILDYEIPYFLSHLFFKINDYLKEELPKNLKQILITKKYLLLSTPELVKIEEVFLKDPLFTNYELPLYNTTSDQNFTSLYIEVFKKIISLDHDDSEIINNPNIHTNVIISILFIKNFLELSQNTTNKEEIINTILNSKFYHSPNYNIVTDLLNKVIFTDTYIKER